ncbi:MAG: transketolase [candidate division KSB1 bacterium]|nr:transketolase [candidate division KSB1 bacterium]
MSRLDSMSIEELTINTIRTLAMDGVQKANSGHPGTPMALAPLAYLLFKDIMRHNPADPHWPNRDRFVLSAGHASMLLYSILHLSGYDLDLEELKNFRQLGSKTPGHPEYGETPGVETTTGPLGQGIANSVGMAIAEAHLAAIYNRPGFNLFDHYTYAVCSDGDLMEGISHEAASLAGHLKLGKLIWFYDDNHITIEGDTKLAYSDDVRRRFEGYGWHVIDIGDHADDLPLIAQAVKEAQQVSDKPSLIIIRTHIAKGSPNLQDTSKAHGAPLGEAEVALTKKNYGWPEDAQFLVPERVRQHMAEIAVRGAQAEQEWNRMFAEYQKKYPSEAMQLQSALRLELPEGWDNDVPVWKPEDGAQATRTVSGKVLNAIAGKVPYLIGGSADLSPSTMTLLKDSPYFSATERRGRNIAWGVRELGMAAACSGIALHGGLRPFCATFFVFTDYARPAIRLAALMKLPVIYVMTHDSIGVGEDGPTHQPIEHLAALRAIPGLTVIRPADANETAYAWRAAMLNTDGPTMLVLTRQNVPVIDRLRCAGAEGLLKGGYILLKEKGNLPALILIATGSEVQLALEAADKLSAEGIDVRVVSMPSWELFRRQPADYRESVLPSSVQARVSIEAASTLGWREFVGDKGLTIGIDRFGLSGPFKKVYEFMGLTADNIAAKAKSLL